MYPDLIRIGTFTITSFGLFVGLGAACGLWVFSRELRRSGLPQSALDGAILGVLGGLIGAKLLYVAEHVGQEPLFALLLDRGGMSWFGGLFGGVGSALLLFRVRRLPIVPILAASTPALAVGHLLGRIGCFLVGDDYGRPSSLPWAVAFPRGLPPTTERVHPTQLYEALFLGILAVLLIRWRRQGTADATVVGRYLLLAGGARFLNEFIRINPSVALGMTVAQWGALLLMALGAVILLRSPRHGDTTASVDAAAG
jgi:phosphatidylglycerol:prolipoprotein diacylglycerol transferase